MFCCFLWYCFVIACDIIIQIQGFYQECYNSKILKRMQNQTSKQNFHSKMDQFRRTIRIMPIIGQKSRDLNQRYDNFLKQKKRKDSQNSLSNEDTSQCQSNLTGFSDYSEETHYYNSFLEKYQLLEKLGQGANGCVFRCRYKPNNRFYAAKKFRIQKEHILQLKKNFISLKELNHTSICRYKALYFDQNERFAFLVMEYLPFPSLADYRIKSEEELKIIVKEIISAITCIHNRNLCHRDIKPENILYDEKTKKIKIIDFGISKKTFSRGTRRDMLTIIGTHFYLAPEVYNGGGYDQRIDIWALGVTVFKLITGYTPFESEYHSDTIANILKGQVSFEDTTWKKYSPFAQYFVSQLLKNQKERLTLSQAAKHLWFQSQQQSSKKTTLRKMRSQNISLCEDFHHQLHNNLRNAVSKQEGSFFVVEQNQETSWRLNKIINLMDVKQYCLDDSDEQDSVVTPKGAKIGVKLDNSSPFLSGLKQGEELYS